MDARVYRKVESLHTLNCRKDKKRQKWQLALSLFLLLAISLCIQVPRLLSAQSLNNAFSYVLFSNSGKMKIKEGVTIAGNIFHNGEVTVKENAQVIDGRLYATGNVTIKEGAQVVEGEQPNPLPLFPQFDTSNYNNLLNQAHDQPEEEKKLTNVNLNGDTLFIHGKMVLKDGGNISGPGMIVVDGEITIKEDSVIGPEVTIICSEKLKIKENTTIEHSFLFSKKEVKIKEECNIKATIRSLENVLIKEDVSFNGLIHTLDKVKIKEESNINGIIIAGKEIVVLENTVITYDPSVISSCMDDTTPPIINITSPIDNKTINTTTPQITIEFSDNVCGIDPNSFTAQINNVESGSLFNVTEAGATYQITSDLPEGLHVISATISDFGGNTANAKVAFTVEIPSPCDSDTTPPIINIIPPIDGETINITTPQITIEFSDDICGIDKDSFTAQINNVESNTLFTVTETGATYQVITDLPEGENVITASINDLGGNTANASVTFKIELPSPCDRDTSPPIINIISPIDSETTNTPTQIIIEFTDDICGIDKDSFTSQINGTESNTMFNVTETGATSQTITDLPEGENIITASISDLGGNTANVSTTFTVEKPSLCDNDTTPPIINITSPIDGETINTTSPQIIIEFSDEICGIDPDSFTAQINNVEISNLFTVTDTNATYLVTTSIPEGESAITASIRDLGGNTANVSTTFTIEIETPPTNDTPTLGSIGNRSVDVGSILSFTVTTSDTNDDNIDLIVTPIPLPANVTFNCGTGLFTFTPDITQAGVSFDLIFIGSNGILTDTETITITVNDLPLSGVTSLQGRILDANDAQLGIITPIVGAIVRSTEKGISATTNSSGHFTLSDLNAGINHFEYDGTTVSAPDGFSYGSYIGMKEIIANVTNKINRPVYLMRIDTAGQVKINPSSTTVLNNPNLNITLTIPPNTVKDENGDDYTGMLSISEVPAGFTPASLPENLDPGMVFSVQPMGLTFVQPAPITFPNFDNLTPGSEVNIWSLNHTTGKFFIAGTGLVSPDRSVINTIQGGIQETSWHFPVSAPLTTTKNDPDLNEKSDKSPDPCTEKTKSGFVIQTGNFFEDHTLPSYRSLGVSRGLKLNYNSTNAFPCPIITAQANVPGNSAVPIAISASLKVGGLNFDNETFKFGTSTLSRQSSMFDATNIDTGNYPYFLEIKSHYNSSTVSSNIVGNIIVNNQISSPFGPGWTIDGIQKINNLNSLDGRVLLTEGNGSAKLFSTRPVGSGEFSNAASFFVGGLVSSIVSGDFDGDDVLDIVTANSKNGTFGDTISTLLGDGSGAFTSPIDLFIGGVSYAMTVGDFNGDNLLDIARANAENDLDDDSVSILLGDGTGNFSLYNDFPIGNYPQSIITDDFNGDNVLDLATANNFDDSVSVLIGDGTGNFTRVADVQVGIVPISITVGDFNNDDVPDLATANWLGDTISILTGDGAGNFLVTNDLAVNNPVFIINGDYNGDNLLDLAVSDINNNAVSVLLGDGDGNFSDPTDFQVDTSFGSIAQGDFNEDKIVDFAVANNSRSEVSILLGDGFGNFSSPSIFATGDASDNIAIGDYNEDNILDIATSRDSDNTITVLIGLTASPDGPPGDFSTLSQNSNNSFTRTMKNGTIINFDVNGLHSSTIDQNGNTTTYSYDTDGLLTTITDPMGLVTTLNYQSGLLSNVTDPVGRITSFQHDNNGNLTSIINPDGTESSYTYDSRHLMSTETEPNGNTHTINYSFAGRFESMDFADGRTKQLSPSIQKGLVDPSSGVGDSVENPAANLPANDINSTITDSNGNITTVKTDKFGRITQSTDNCCLGRITEIERNENSLPTKVTRANGAATINTYDDNGNILTSNDQSIGAITTFTYDSTFNQVTSITDPKGNTTTITYDMNGNPLEIVDAQNNTTTQTFNSQGQLTGITDALGSSTSFTYNTNGNLKTTTDPLGNVTTLTTDSSGNVITATDANGKVTQFAYDTLNRLTQVTDANGDITNYSYDANGNLTLVTDANGNITTFAYDSMDRLITKTDPLGNSDTFEYDGNENLISRTDRNGQTINFQYDNLNQLINKTLPGNLVTTLDYDLVGNLTSITDPDSNLTFTYDGTDRLINTSTTGSPNQPDVTINYTYDANGNRLTMTDSLTGTTNYLYDTLNRIITITNPPNQTVNFGYDALSRRASTTLPNGVTTDYAYDSNSRITNLQHKLGITTLSSFSYTYDNVVNRIAMNTTRSGLIVNNSLNYVYDNIYQLTQATRPLPAQPAETFNYDPLGNRLQRDGETIDSTIGQANQLLNDATFAYIYDNNGNLVQKTDKSTNETTDYIYDAENRLIRINLPGGNVAQYRYDGLGRRIEKDVDGSITRYVYDNEDILLEFDGNNSQIARYTHGFGFDEPLIMKRGGVSLYYLADGLGSITDLTDSTGAIAQSYVYDSFGNIDQQVGPLENPYTYTGRELDAESGLYYYRARYYEAIVGRFINEDPIEFTGSDNNFYRYVQNNPVSFVDPFGLIGTDRSNVPNYGTSTFGDSYRDFLRNDFRGYLNSTSYFAGLFATTSFLVPGGQPASLLFTGIGLTAKAIELGLYSDNIIIDSITESAKLAIPLKKPYDMLANPGIDYVSDIVDASLSENNYKSTDKK